MYVRFLKLSLFIFAMSVTLLTFFSNIAYAEIPLKIGYQGRLKSAAGAAQTGTFTFTIRGYNASSGGTLLFTDVQSGISVSDGYFSLQIDTGSNVNFNQDVWITAEVNSDGEMTPRVKLASVGTAYVARTVGDLLPSQLMRNDAANTLQGGAANTISSTAGAITLQPAGSGTVSAVQVGAGGAGSATPDFLGLDVKSTAGDPAGGVNGYMYYNASSSKMRCFEAGAWKDCDTIGGGSLQTTYNTGATITTASSTDIAFTLTSGNFTASGAGSVNLTPTGASSFTSGGALTLTGGAASTWKTTSGNLTIDSASALNLGTTDAASVSIGKSSTTTTVNGPLAVSKYIDVSSAAAPTYQEGRLFYDTQFKSLSYYTDISGLQMNIGRTMWARAKNLTGVTIPKGSVVYINGVDGLGNITIALAQANSLATSQAAGIVTQDIATGSLGYITYMGAILNLDTSAFTSGSTVYLSATTPGGMTSTRPSAPNYAMSLGVVAISHATQGAIGTSITTNVHDGSFTAGSVIFGSTEGLRAQDATNFFWNDTTNRLGIGDNTPAKTLTIGNGTPGSNLFGVDGATGDVTTQGNITLSNSGGGLTATGGALSLQGGAASSFATTAGNITIQPAGSGTAANVQIGAGGAGSTTPDLFAVDVKSTAGDPAGFNGAMYYNEGSDRFRCYENGAWKDCDGGVVASFQTAYNNGGSVTTASNTPIAFTLTSGDFTATGAGAVNLTPTGASSFTSGGALTLTGGAASTWSTSAGNLTLQAGSGTVSLGSSTNLTTNAGLTVSSGSSNITLQPAGTGTTANVQIGAGGAGSATPDLLGLDVKSTAGDPAGFNGATYYNASSNKFRCYINGSWSDCDTTGGSTALQSAYNSGASITTAGSTDIALTLTSGNFTASGAGSVNLTPTGASSFTSGGALTFTGGATSTWGTTAGNVILQPAGSGTTATIQIGAGGAGSTTPDLFGVDVKSTAGDPAGFNGAMYYNNNLNSFRCYVNGGWQDCGATAASATTLQQAYVAGETITTTGSVDLAVVLTSGNFTASGAGSVNLTPTGASSFTSGGALTLTGGAASTWGTTSGNLTLQAAGTGTTANVQIGAGGVGSTTPDLLGLDVKSSAGDPVGFNGATYYNANSNKFRCYVNGSWVDCDTTTATTTLQQAYNNGATITTAGSTNIAYTLTSGNFTASGAGSVNLTPTGASSFTSGGALTLQGGAASTWKTTSGALTLDAATALNLGTVDATSISVGKSGTVATINGSLAIPNYIDFTTASNPAYSEGRFFYDQTAKTLAYYNDESTVTMNLGQESWIRVRNTSGSTVTDGQVVYINGADIGTSLPTIALARADLVAGSEIIGLVTHSIENNTNGYITQFGIVNDLDTSSFSSGDPIYLSATTAGALTTTRPTNPDFSVSLGSVVTSHASTGKILVTAGKLREGSFTTGSVSFGGSDGFLKQDNTHIFWDDTNNRLGIGDNTPAKTLTIGNGTPGSNLFGVDGTTGDIATQGNITLSSGGGTIVSTGGGLTLQGGGASTWSTTSGALTIDAATALNLGTTNATSLSVGKAGITTTNSGALVVTELLTGNLGATISGATTSINASSNFATNINTGTSTGAVTIGNTAAGVLQLISGSAFTLQGGAASTVATTSGNITLQAAGTGTTANIQIGAGGAGSTTPDLFVLDAKSNAGDPTGTNGAMYYNANTNKFRCYQNGAWSDCVPPSTILARAAADKCVGVQTGPVTCPFSGATATPLDDPDLVFAIGANQTWEVEGSLQVTNANATPDVQIAFTIPSGATMSISSHSVDTAATTSTADVYVTSGTSSGLIPITAAGIATIHFKGIVVNSTNAGNVQVQWAQNTSDTTAGRQTIMKANSFIKGTLVP